MQKILFFLIAFFCNGHVLFGQVRVDSAAVKSSVDSILRIADQYRKIGKNQNAFQEIEGALNLAKNTLGDESLTYAKAANDLASIYYLQGKYLLAEPLMLRVMEIRGKKLGKKHNNYGAILSNLGLLYHQMGQFERAENFLLESKSILKLTVNENNILRYSNTLNNLAILYKDMGRYDEAEKFHLEVRKIREKRLPGDSPEITRNLNNLAIIYRTLGQYDKADSLLSINRKIWQNREDKPRDYINTLNTLATIRVVKKEYANALELFKEIDALFDKSESALTDYAIYYSNLANTLLLMDSLNRVDSLLSSAKRIVESSFGKDNQFYISTMEVYLFYWYKANKQKAIETTVRELSEISQKLLTREATYLSEYELTQYVNAVEQSFDEFNHYAFHYQSNDLIETAFNNALFLKGFVLSEVMQIRQSLENAVGDTQSLFLQWKEVCRHISGEYTKPVSERQLLEQMEAEANRFEREIYKLSKKTKPENSYISCQAIKDLLKQNEAVIEFVHFRGNFPNENESVIYAALILRNEWSYPRFIPLFTEEQWAKSFTCSGLTDFECAKKHYSLKQPSPIYNLLWRPIDSLLTGVKTVHYAPSGQLHLLDFDAIHTGDGKTLADCYQLVRLGSTRQLASSPLDVGFDTQNLAVLFGSVRYDADSIAVAHAVNSFNFPKHRGQEIQFGLVDSTLRTRDWAFLEGTEKEVKNIQALLLSNKTPSQVFSGFGATEEAFKQIGQNTPVPRILHLATHGFFFPNPTFLKTRKNKKADRITLGNAPAFAISEHPMIRSGLVLAGANQAWKHGKPFREGAEDGILTAYEISQMNLHGTELVVLSACQTGLGDLQSNEGVYGLQRAFKIAGVRYLIMSLQRVPDGPAQEFMTIFYKKWLKRKLSLPDAFRAAQSAMRKKYPDQPLNWSGWVLVE